MKKGMNILKKYGLIAALILSVLLMVVIRLSDTNHFKPDAQKWAKPSLSKSNILSLEQADQLEGLKLIISDGHNDDLPIPIDDETKQLSFDEVLTKNSLRIIRKHEGPIFVFSNETSVSARIWMLISQMGYDEVFIITSNILDKS